MAHVSPNDTDMEAKSFVGLLLLRERFTWNHQWFLTSAGGLMTVPKWLPGARMLTSYRISWLRRDVVAGIVLCTLLVPQGMAYAELAGLPPITGLYTTVLCLIGYAVFGPSRILVLGPDSSLGPMIAATILPILGAMATLNKPSPWHPYSH